MYICHYRIFVTDRYFYRFICRARIGFSIRIDLHAYAVRHICVICYVDFLCAVLKVARTRPVTSVCRKLCCKVSLIESYIRQIKFRFSVYPKLILGCCTAFCDGNNNIVIPDT